MSDYLKKIETEINRFRSYGEKEVTLANCDKEPIHLIGHVQSHGVLIASHLNTDIRRIDFLSDNSSELLGIDCDALLGQPLDSLVSQHSLDMIHQAVSSQLHNAHSYYDVEIHSPRVSSTEASFHVHNDILFIELQPFLADDMSLANFSSAGKDIIADFTTRMLKTYSFEELAKTMVKFFYEQLGYDRVMVYKFDEDGHGEVIAEEKKSQLEPFLGLHYPASDIPQFARYLYVQNRCRIISNIQSTPVPIRSGLPDVNHDELDLRFSNLRSMSPIHIEYLANMGIQASVTMSIVKDNKLLGMLIMHHYSPRYCELKAREIINQLSYITSDYAKLLERIEVATGTERSQQIRNLINIYLFDNENDVDYADVADTMMHVFNVDGVYVCVNGEQLFSTGLIHQQVDTLAGSVGYDRLFKSQIYYSSNIAKDFPVLFGEDNRVCGMMVINLPSEKPSFIAMFRREQAQLVRWAGRKQEYSEEADGRLHARKSFKEWQEFTKNQSQAWSSNDLLNAKNIRAVFIRYLLRVNEKNLAKLVSFDPLTELPNRNYITNHIDSLLGEGRRLSLLFIDCDRFKTINDSLGHDVGDKVLQEVGKRLKSLESKNSEAARLGGDEFTMLMLTTDPLAVEKMASDIVDAFRQPISFDHYNFHVPASIGVAIADANSTRSSLMRSADMAMYEAKQNGGNSYKFVSHQLLGKADERLAIEQDIYNALNNNEIINYYQPLTESHTHSIFGFEVLCRWKKSSGEIIPPLKFLGVAEETGIIIAIGLCVIDNALSDLKRMHDIAPDLVMTLNFSPRQLLDDVTANYLIEETAIQGIDASKIWIEMTEESYIEDEKALIRTMHRLKANRFKMVLDDFGSGYSSLKYLTSLPIDVVKFDKTLIDDICDDARSLELLKASKQLADVCEMVTVAEGIERQVQSDCISDVGISYQQGYLFGKPVDIESTLALLKAQSD